MYWDLKIEDGIGYLTIDDPDEPVNTLGEDSMSELEDDVKTLETQKLKGLMIRSGKEDNFVAGADIEELREVSSKEEAYEASRRGQRLLQRISSLPYPTVALVHGSCLGGGFELALACDYRVVSNSDKTELGLPEVKLGILPGWGGTQRLPRLIGVKDAIGRLLKGSSMDSSEAKSTGVADDVVAKANLEDTVRSWISRNSFPGKGFLDWQQYNVFNLKPVRWFILRQAEKRTKKQTKGNMPAPIKIIESVREGLGKDLESALEIEAQKFSELAVTDECMNLTRVFFLREDQKKYTVDESAGDWSPEDVTVIGGGTMGSGITHWISSREIKSTMLDIDEDAVEAGMERIESTFDKGVSAGAVSEKEKEESMDRINPTTDYDDAKGSDLVIEAVVEDMEIKETVFNQLEPQLDEDTVVSSNTSALDVESMAEFLPYPENMVGLHFFNPVYQMPLIEIVKADSTSEEALHKAVEFVKRIDKVPVVVKNSPGFLVNRVLGPYMNEAGNLLDEGYSIEDVDSALEQFGMPMGPLKLLDEVGIDVAHHVAGYLSDELEVSFEIADVFSEINDSGLTGKKGGEGFYRYEDGDRSEPNPEFNPSSPRDNPDYDEIARRLVDLIIAESVRCLEDEIVESANQLDIAMILGTGFAPFTGGPLNHAENYGLKKVVSELKNFEEAHGEQFEVPEMLQQAADEESSLTEPVR